MRRILMSDESFFPLFSHDDDVRHGGSGGGVEAG
jgi:hypothetical protein